MDGCKNGLVTVEVEVTQRDSSRLDPDAIRKAVLAVAAAPGAVLADIANIGAPSPMSQPPPWESPSGDLLVRTPLDHVESVALRGMEDAGQTFTEDATLAEKCKVSLLMYFCPFFKKNKCVNLHLNSW